MAGKLFCGHCNRTVRKHSRKFFCQNPSTKGVPACYDGGLSRDVLERDVLEKVKSYIGKEIKSAKSRFSFSDKKKLEQELATLEEKRASIFENLLENKITQSEFEECKKKVNKQIRNQCERIDEWRKQQALVTKFQCNERPIDTLRRLCKASELTKEHMQFVKIINVNSVDDYEIILYEDSPLTVLCRNMSIYEEA